ncbi:uncharacterized protein [Palaemon carinicauda]|uniref:uncharacterized protein n=1 Tax=Palaemon carinicauda TaxID=392227 RepID=UPI0035B661E7
MVYQCHLTKFVILHPITSKRAAEVAFKLLDILLIYDTCILQSDNGYEFTAYMVRRDEGSLAASCAWQAPREAQSQGIKSAPYATLLGEDPKVGLNSTSLLQEVIDRLETEDDLAALGSQPLTHPTDEPLEASEPVIIITQPLVY